MKVKASNTTIQRDLLTLKEAAIVLGRSEKTVRNRIKEIPHYEGPLGPRFKRDELERWLCQVECKPIVIA